MKRSGQDKSDKTQRNFRSIKAHGKPKKKENMKSNRFSTLIAAGVAGAFALGTALAQDTSTTTSVTAVSTSTMDGAGTITTYTPGSDYISFRTETSAEPVKYYYTSKSTVVDSDGHAVEWSMLKPDMPVHYTYTKDGDRMVITRVTLDRPISYYEKKETTTTSTTP